jgi:hypothetical protein
MEGQMKGVVIAILLHLMAKEHTFVHTWTMVSLCLYGRCSPQFSERIIHGIAPCLHHKKTSRS